MRPERRQELEQNGYQVIEHATLDSYWNTTTFILTPDGRTLADYSNLADIPVLEDNTGISIDQAAFPYDDQIGFYTAEENGGVILYAGESAGVGGSLILWYGWVVILALAVSTVLCIFMITSAMHPDPLCKQEPRQQDIGTCAKLIVMPNCDTRLFNPCTGQWIDSEWTSHGTTDWIWYIFLGLGIIAAIVIIPKILGLFSGSIRLGGGGGAPPRKEYPNHELEPGD